MSVFSKTNASYSVDTTIYSIEVECEMSMRVFMSFCRKNKKKDDFLSFGFTYV